MKVIGLYSFVLLFIGYYMLEEVESLKGNFYKIYLAIIQKDKKKLNKIF